MSAAHGYANGRAAGIRIPRHFSTRTPLPTIVMPESVTV